MNTPIVGARESKCPDQTLKQSHSIEVDHPRKKVPTATLRVFIVGRANYLYKDQVQEQSANTLNNMKIRLAFV
jgi:hypothetical protein